MLGSQKNAEVIKGVKMRFTKIAITLFAIVGASQSYSADYEITVCTLQANDNGKAYILPCEGWTTKNNCPSTAPWITWNTSSDAGKIMYSTALTAFAAGNKISVRTDGSTCDSYDVTSIISIKK